ncbi:calcium-binding protein [Synechococcus elongatus]|uniref:Calcium-binding protein n=1 Tax=Synechococcus elongatus PCC 11801 TaxID=2219813 RepID=A0AAN1UUI8_SYNEL|nr:calcium-binding protein [Synechococcus elongatus]AZB72606.1 hypothetical protein DOP62_07695 [Synechococcus elongatus PCC 11801]
MSSFLSSLALSVRRLINTPPTVTGLSIGEDGVRFTATDITRVRLFGTSFALFRDPLSYVSPFNGLGSVRNGSETTLSAFEQLSARSGVLQIADGLRTVDVGVYLGLGTNGADTFDASATNNPSNYPAALYGFGGDDNLVGGIGNDGLFGGDGNDTLLGREGNDTINGNDGDDVINGNQGTDLINGGIGNDIINGGRDNDTIDGGEGNDTISGDLGDDIILGGSGDDVINYNLDTGGADSINGGEGQDIIQFATVATQIRLTFTSSEVGNDNPNDGSTNSPQDGGLAVRAQAEDNSDGLIGSAGRIDDEGVTFIADGVTTFDVRDISGIQRGDQFKVAVLGTQAADTFDFSSATVNYYVNAGQGNDSINGGSGNDFLVGSEGDDTIRGLNGNDSILGGIGNDSINGNVGDDLVDGGVGNDILNGGQNNDTILGGEGNDTISGDLGNDSLNGGAGADRLTGGADSDVFVQGATSSVAPTQIQNLTAGNIRFDSATIPFVGNVPATVITFDGGVDVITDFQVGIDRLDIDAVSSVTTAANLVVNASNLPNNTLFLARGDFDSVTNKFTFNAFGGSDTLVAQSGGNSGQNDSLFTNASIFILEDVGPAALLVNEVFASTFI